MRWAWVAAPIAVLVVMLGVFAVDDAVEGHPPNPPTGVVTSATGTTQLVKFTPPTDDGDSAITSYLATCTSDDQGATKTQTGAASPLTMSGLSIGKTYTCAVAATNNDGTSGDSDPSAPFVFKTKPSDPSPVSAVPYQSGVARVIWNAPGNSGGTPITGYVVAPYRGSTAEGSKTFDSTATTQLMKGLAVGRTYSFTVQAKNALGLGPASAKTAPITIGTPGQPANVKAVQVSSGSLRITFAAPANGGAAITSYTTRCSSTNGGTARSQTKVLTPQNSSPTMTISSLTGGKSYTCVVKATNSRGTGPVSAPSPAANA